MPPAAVLLVFSSSTGLIVNRGRIVFLALSLALAACADESAPHTVAATDQSAASRIEIDQATGAIRFFVKGQEQARIDAAGLHVRQGIDASVTTVRGDENLPPTE